jgi:hypothetical protein
VPRVGESEHRGGTAGGLVNADLLTGRRGHGKNAIADRPTPSRGARIVRRRLINDPDLTEHAPTIAGTGRISRSTTPPDRTTPTEARLRVAASVIGERAP